MNFIRPIRLLFNNLSDAKTALFTSESNVVIKSIRCCNKSGRNIRLNLQVIALLENPIQEAFIQEKLLILPNQTTDLLAIIYGNSSEVVEHRLFDGDSLICYSDGYDDKFDCIITGYEEVEIIT
ncbi:hypothetical protein [Megaira polyxenophila phage MAnkyphage_25.80]|nr:hypothetical protein [Megaira polyxenophila phage MAnkyphage_25.80]